LLTIRATPRLVPSDVSGSRTSSRPEQSEIICLHEGLASSAFPLATTAAAAAVGDPEER